MLHWSEASLPVGFNGLYVDSKNVELDELGWVAKAVELNRINWSHANMCCWLLEKVHFDKRGSHNQMLYFMLIFNLILIKYLGMVTTFINVSYQFTNTFLGSWEPFFLGNQHVQFQWNACNNVFKCIT